MRKYFDLKDKDTQEIPCKKGYKARLVEDKINGIGFFVLEKTPELIEIESLKQQLTDTDYQAIKYAEGQISEEKYSPIREERQAWRDRINELEIEIESEEQKYE